MRLRRDYGMRHNAVTALDLWEVDRPLQKREVESPPRLYERGHIPVVDIHVHINSYHSDQDDVLDATKNYLQIMDDANIAMAVNLSGSKETIARSTELVDSSDGRILLCPGTFFHGEVTDLWWTEQELQQFAQDPQIAGLKIWCKYERPLLQGHIQNKLKAQDQLQIPAIGMHIADPPAPRFWQENYWECISDAEKVIRSCPGINFIMAHGFWLMTNDQGLSVLATLFDAYPNLHVDLSAVFQWWDGPEPTYDLLRDFIIKYKDRILFGTDGNPKYTTTERYQDTFTILEGEQKNLQPFFGDGGKTHIWGLNLPEDVLNYVYYWNAARLVPEIKQAIDRMGLLSPV